MKFEIKDWLALVLTARMLTPTPVEPQKPGCDRLGSPNGGWIAGNEIKYCVCSCFCEGKIGVAHPRFVVQTDRRLVLEGQGVRRAGLHIYRIFDSKDEVTRSGIPGLELIEPERCAQRVSPSVQDVLIDGGDKGGVACSRGR